MAFWKWTERRRERVRRRGFPSAWSGLLRQTFPRYRLLPVDDRTELEGLILVFVAEKRFEGAAGLAMSDEIRVTIAAQACLLLLHRSTDIYPGLRSVIVYPSEYLVRHRAQDEAGLVQESLQVRQGETAARGAVVISWEAAQRGAAGPNEGRNVVLHEFAHLLDAEFGGFDGAPRLPDASMYEAWSRVLRAEYEALRARGAKGEPLGLDAYAASNPAEFFAVATERFFQQPNGLSRDAPALFAELARYYRHDPRRWGNAEVD